jgi:hypothetical protein
MLNQWTSGPLPVPILDHLTRESMWQPGTRDEEFVMPLQELAVKVNGSIAGKETKNANALPVLQAGLNPGSRVEGHCLALLLPQCQHLGQQVELGSSWT